jgi:hypothetical protein
MRRATQGYMIEGIEKMPGFARGHFHNGGQRMGGGSGA